MSDQLHLTNTSLKLGELLIQEGFASQDDIDTALAIQRKESEEMNASLGMILVQKGLVTNTQIKQLLEHPEVQNKIANHVVEKGIIDKPRMLSCLKKLGESEQVGDLLIKEGLITKNQLKPVLNELLDSVTFGELAVSQGLISRKDLDDALSMKTYKRAIGEILCDMNCITLTELNYIFQKYTVRLKLGEILLQQEIIDFNILRRALQEQKKTKEPLGKLLLRKKIINIEQLYFALSIQYNIPFQRLDGFVFNRAQIKELHQIVSRTFAKKNLILPLYLTGNTLTLAVFHPDKISILNELRARFGHLRMVCVLITEEKFEQLYAFLYGEILHAADQNKNKKSFPESIDTEEFNVEEPGFFDEKTYDDLVAREIDEIVQFIIKYGIINKTDEIRINHSSQGVALSYLMDGDFQQIKIRWLEKKLKQIGVPVILKIKKLAKLSQFRRTLPQEGVFTTGFFDKEKKQNFDLDLKVSTYPTPDGEDIVIKIEDFRKAKIELDHLSLSSHVADPFKQLLKTASGLVLISGRTGTGREETLYGALDFIFHPEARIIDIESHIKIRFPGVLQVQADSRINLTLAKLLASALIFKPDAIFLSEIDSSESAKKCVNAVKKGHFIISTIDAEDAVGAVSRLIDFEIDYKQIASVLKGVIAQKKAGKICSTCRKKYYPPEEEWKKFFTSYPSRVSFYKGEGCERCSYTGYHGHIFLSEILLVDWDMASALNKKPSIPEIRDLARAEGMKCMMEDGLMRLGETTLSELGRLFSPERIRECKPPEADSAIGREEIAITNPELDKVCIEQFYESFVLLHTENDGRDKLPEKEIFMEFITDSYNSVCNQHNCRKVLFILESKNGKPSLSAAPIEELNDGPVGLNYYF